MSEQGNEFGLDANAGPLDDDVEGHRYKSIDDEDVEGHRYKSIDDEDVEGHRYKSLDGADEDDVEGHRMLGTNVQPPRDTDLGGTEH